MGRSHGSQTRVIVNDAHLSGRISGWRYEHRRGYADVTNLLAGGDQWEPGLLGGSCGINGFFDSAADNITEVIDAAAAVEAGLVVTAFVQTPAVGSFAWFSQGNITARDVPAAVRDAVKLNITGTPNDGVDLGYTLHVEGARTADGNGSSVDGGVSSAGGAAASLHVTAFTGFTGAIIKVQHSPDNAAWADLITFTTVTGKTWERGTATGTVDRYLRATWDVTGTGSLTFAVVGARR